MEQFSVKRPDDMWVDRQTGNSLDGIDETASNKLDSKQALFQSKFTKIELNEIHFKNFTKLKKKT